MTKQLFFLRHGRTGYSGRYIGSSDVSLTEEGKEQIQHVQSRLGGSGITKILCSPMLRCLQSCDILDLGLEVEVEEYLKEIDFGDWEKKSFDEIAADEPALVDQWAAHPSEFVFPGGDAVVDFIDRVMEIQQSIVNSSHKKILVISHGGVIRLLLCLFLSLPLENHLLFRVEKGKIVTLELFDQGGVLTGFNLVK